VVGFSGLQLALLRDGVYEELCPAPNHVDDGSSGLTIVPGVGTSIGVVSAGYESAGYGSAGGIGLSSGHTTDDDIVRCEARILKLASIYTAGATTFQASMLLWGVVLDRYGSVAVRVASLVVSVLGNVLMAFGDSQTFDVFVAAGILLGAGGSGFFFSHFVLADHFRECGRAGA